MNARLSRACHQFSTVTRSPVRRVKQLATRELSMCKELLHLSKEKRTKRLQFMDIMQSRFPWDTYEPGKPSHLQGQPGYRKRRRR